MDIQQCAYVFGREWCSIQYKFMEMVKILRACLVAVFENCSGK